MYGTPNDVVPAIIDRYTNSPNAIPRNPHKYPKNIKTKRVIRTCNPNE